MISILLESLMQQKDGPNLHYYLGESYYDIREYDSAIREWLLVLQYEKQKKRETTLNIEPQRNAFVNLILYYYINGQIDKATQLLDMRYLKQ